MFQKQCQLSSQRREGSKDQQQLEIFINVFELQDSVKLKYVFHCLQSILKKNTFETMDEMLAKFS